MTGGSICVENDYDDRNSVIALIIDALEKLGFNASSDGDRSGIHINFDSESNVEVPEFLMIKVPVCPEAFDDDEDEEDDEEEQQ